MRDIGSGAPVVVVPGVQGRWEWMGPAVDALAERCRVITNSLPGDPGSIAGLDQGVDFDIHVAWLDVLLARIPGSDRRRRLRAACRNRPYRTGHAPAGLQQDRLGLRPEPRTKQPGGLR